MNDPDYEGYMEDWFRRVADGELTEYTASNNTVCHRYQVMALLDVHEEEISYPTMTWRVVDA